MLARRFPWWVICSNGGSPNLRRRKALHCKSCLHKKSGFCTKSHDPAPSQVSTVGLRPCSKCYKTAFVVGVAQRDLFWKDIRRVLFLKARYTVFCRLATEGVAETWHPVKVADVLAGIVPQFDEMIREFSEEARRAMTAGYTAPPSPAVQHGLSDSQVLEKYVALLVAHHSQTLGPAAIDSLIREISPAKEWPTRICHSLAVY